MQDFGPTQRQIREIAATIEIVLVELINLSESEMITVLFDLILSKPISTISIPRRIIDIESQGLKRMNSFKSLPNKSSIWSQIDRSYLNTYFDKQVKIDRYIDDMITSVDQITGIHVAHIHWEYHCEAIYLWLSTRSFI